MYKCFSGRRQRTTVNTKKASWFITSDCGQFLVRLRLLTSSFYNLIDSAVQLKMNNFTVLILLFGYIYVVQSQNSCVTPNGEQARCISIYQCQVFLDALSNVTPEIKSFMKASQCGYQANPLVCCGTVASYQTITTPTSRKPTVTQPSTPAKTNPLNHRNINLLPSKDICGVQTLQDKIFGGQEAGIDEYPWMALLEYRNRGASAGHSCGGVLIGDRYVLTAAHCVVGAITRQVGTLYRIRLGEYNQKTAIDCVDIKDQYGVPTGEKDCAEPHQDIDVEEAIAHPQYIDGSLNRYHDIAIVRLSRKVSFTDFIKPICLPLNGEATAPGQTMDVAGWGYTEKRIFSSVKLRASVPAVSNAECGDVYSRMYGVRLADTQMCAGGVEGVDSCNGDSGGPLMALFPQSSEYYVEGVVSFGARDCGTRGVPGVYTRVTSYVNWLLDNMKP